MLGVVPGPTWLHAGLNPAYQVPQPVRRSRNKDMGPVMVQGSGHQLHHLLKAKVVVCRLPRSHGARQFATTFAWASCRTTASSD